MPDNQELVEQLGVQLAALHARKVENDELLGKVTGARAELGALAATATSPDATVTVEAGPGGIVHSVRLTNDALHTDAATLSVTITTTIRAAIAHATRRQLDIVRTHLGPHIDPAHILGPQAVFAAMATNEPPPEPDDEDDEDEPPASYLAR